MVSRRAPIRRYRRARRSIRRRPRRKIRARRSGNFVLKVRKTVSVLVPPKEGHQVHLAVKLQDFNEIEAFFGSFEAYRIHYLKVKVIPQFNVADAKTYCPNYYLAPWHREEPVVNSNTILSIDKCKTYHGSRTAQRSFVPAVLASIGTLGQTSFNYSKTSWRPRIELSGSAHTIPHFCGLLYFGSNPTGASTVTSYPYEIEYECKITLYNQKNFAG